MFPSRLATYPLWRSLRHRNYRLYLIGQLVSVCGTWMQQVAQSWLIYRLTGSATLLGLVGFATQIPVFVLGAIGGVVSDRYSSHRVALWTQTAALFQAIVLAGLTLAGWIQPLHIILLGVVLGVVNAFDMPARQALVHRLIAPDDLANAVALNSSMINAARIIGPGLAGLLVAKLGEGACFLVNSASYLAVIVALLGMKLPPQTIIPTKALSIVHSLAEGFRYASRITPIRDVLLLLGVVGVMGMPYITLMPVFAADVHNSGADALGLMMGSVGLGALIGALYLAWRSSVIGLGRLIVVATLGFGLALIAFTVSKLYWLSLLLLVAVGLGWMVLIAASNTALQISRRRCHAGACHEPLYPDAGRYGAVWKPPCGMARRPNRRPIDRRDRRRYLRFRRARLRASATAPESSGATDFDRTGGYCRAEHRRRIGRH
jgi:MFS family permease